MPYSPQAVARRVPLLAATAILAAAIGDPLVESIANSGAVGGVYDDINRLSVIPALVAGLLLILGTFVARCLHVWHESSSGSKRDWLSSSAREITSRRPFIDLPIVFSVQMLALFVMENCEQLTASGGLVRGAAWLGGPAWFSLAVHASLSVVCLALLRRLMRTCAPKIVAILHDALRADFAYRNGEAQFIGRAAQARLALALDPCVRRTRGRAPPLQRAFV